MVGVVAPALNYVPLQFLREFWLLVCDRLGMLLQEEGLA